MKTKTKKILNLSKPWLGVAEVSELTGYSADYCYRNWARWREKYQLKIARGDKDKPAIKEKSAYKNERSHLLFERKSVLAMIEKWVIV